MNTSVLKSWRVALAGLVALTLAAAMLLASQGEADAGLASSHVIGVEVDTEMNDGNAAPGNKGSALVSILVTKSRTQRPLSNIASSIARDDAGITLPSRVIFDTLTVAAGGCLVTPVEFINAGDGVYHIRFLPFVDNANCDWNSGDYIYLVTIEGVGGAVLGEGLAKLSL